MHEIDANDKGAPDITAIFGQKHLPSLDGLRFLAVLFVILDHGGLQHYGGDGVTYFFVLSGFLFATLLSRQWDAGKTISYRRFYFRRTFRIVPACYCCLIFTITMKNLLGLEVDYVHALSAFTYTTNYYNAVHGHPPTGFSFFWSLAVEEQFYLVWPIVFVTCMQRGRRTLMSFLCGTVLLVCLWRSWLCLGLNVSTAWLYNAFDTRIDSIAIGCLMGMLIQEKSLARFFKSLGRSGFMPLGMLSCLAICHMMPPEFHYSVGFTLESLFIGLLLVQLVIFARHPLWRWLNWKPIAFLGVLSYSMYLYHAWGLAAGRKLSMLPLTAQVLAGVGFTILLAAGSYFIVERPFQRLRDRWEPLLDHQQATQLASSAQPTSA